VYFAALFVAFASATIEKDGEVLVLTENDFDTAISENEFVLVKFYAPWCGHCKSMAPEYAAAAVKLLEEESSVKLAKVDATEHSSLGEKYGVRGYPTLKFFRNGQASEYSGGRQAADIVAWVKKKSGPPAKTLTTADEIKEFIKSAPVAVAGFFKDLESATAKSFISVAGSTDDHPFALVTDDSLFAEHSAEDGHIHLFKDFDEKKNVFEGEVTEEALKVFVSSNALPLVVDFNHETASKIFSGEIKSHMLIFLSKEAGHYDQHLENAKPVAKAHKGKILIVTVNTDEEDHGRILEFFGMDKKEVPGVRIIKLEEDMAKFKPDLEDLSTKSLNDAVEKFFKGEMKQHLLSQALPEDWDKEPVKVLVASNFEEIAFDKEKDVLVEFYAPWCGHCKQLVPIYDELAKKFEDDATVVVAKIDSTQNELEHVKIQSFPTIKLYKKGDNKVVDYDGERTLEGLSTFLAGKKPTETSEEEVDETDIPAKEEL